MAKKDEAFFTFWIFNPQGYSFNKISRHYVSRTSCRYESSMVSAGADRRRDEEGGRLELFQIDRSSSLRPLPCLSVILMEGWWLSDAD